MPKPYSRVGKMSIVALAGGVGGAKFVDGISKLVGSGELTVIVNTGDDFNHLGLKICPDIDTICYTLAGLANPETGWGRCGETWNAMETISRLGGPDWFQLGDLDLGLHLERSRCIQQGLTLSQVTLQICQAFAIKDRVIPMSDAEIPTLLLTDEGELSFQEYFVKRNCEPKILGIHFRGIEYAKPAPGVISAIQTADMIVFCPSNPWVSLDPILTVPGIRNAVMVKKPVIAISPIIGGRTVKGPAAKMFEEHGIKPSAFAVAEHFKEMLAGFVYDEVDKKLDNKIKELGIKTFTTNTLMETQMDRVRLADEVINFASE
jgi:LPPG:FO 2-phospho-L-lactate transferase